MKALTALILCFFACSMSLKAQRSISEIREYIKLHELKGDSCDSLIKLCYDMRDRVSAKYWKKFERFNYFLREVSRYERYLLMRDTSNIYYSLDSALKNPDAVKWLDLSGSGLKRLPRSVLKLKNLEILDLTGLQILEFDSAEVSVARIDFSYKITNMDSLIMKENFDPLKKQPINSYFPGKIRKLPQFIFKMEKLKFYTCFSCINEERMKVKEILYQPLLGGEMDRIYKHGTLYSYPYIFVYPSDTLK